MEPKEGRRGREIESRRLQHDGRAPAPFSVDEEKIEEMRWVKLDLAGSDRPGRQNKHKRCASVIDG